MADTFGGHTLTAEHALALRSRSRTYQPGSARKSGPGVLKKLIRVPTTIRSFGSVLTLATASEASFVSGGAMARLWLKYVCLNRWRTRRILTLSIPHCWIPVFTSLAQHCP